MHDASCTCLEHTVDRIVNRSIAVVLVLFAVGVIARALLTTDVLSFLAGYGLTYAAVWLWDLG